ncbi:hypothetical protein SFRURICE_012187 [Spodoptera frugiperda]|nr:hypothetical protein SFRURICE_012187 [Spodoptera frugiperda]
MVANAEVEISVAPSTSTQLTSIGVNDKEFDEIIDEWMKLTDDLSDMDIEDEEHVIPQITSRNASAEPAVRADITPRETQVLDVEDRQNDLAIRELVSTDCYDFKWTRDRQIFTGRRENFTGTPGPTFEMTDQTRIVERSRVISHRTREKASDWKLSPDIEFKVVGSREQPGDESEVDVSPPDLFHAQASLPQASVDAHPKNELEVISTPEIQNWMKTIDQYLGEVCVIASESKLNSEQKMRISALCRKIGHGTSQMAVQYQSVKMKAVLANSTVQRLEDQINISQQLQELKTTIGASIKPNTGSSFVDMVKKGTNKFIQPLKEADLYPSPLSSVAIYPKNKQTSSDETKSPRTEIICPEQIKLQVRGLRKTRNGGVIISTESKADIEKVKKSMQTTNSGLTVDEPQKRQQRVVIIGVPSSMQEMEVFTCLYNQNLAEKLQECSLETFLSSIKLSHKSGKKDADTCNFIIEVSAQIRKALICKDRVFVNWSSCPVRDFTLVTRCYKCQQYGQTTYMCGHCGESGHSIKKGPKKAEEPKCATCLHFKKPSNHNTGAADCPAKIMAQNRYINSIDYGGA